MKTKIKLMALVAGLLSILPTTSAWASSGGDSTTSYYAALKAKVSTSSSGMGKVYVSTAATSEKPVTDSGYQNESVAAMLGTEQNANVDLYAFAKPVNEDVFEFSHWSTSDNGEKTSSDMPYKAQVQASQTSEDGAKSSPGMTVYANFKEKIIGPYAITFLAAQDGTYSYGGKVGWNGDRGELPSGTVATEDRTVDGLEYSSALDLVAAPADGMKVLGWYVLDANGGKVQPYFSYENAVSGYRVTSATRIGVDFAPDCVAMRPGATGTEIYNGDAIDLATLVADAAGDTTGKDIMISKDVVLADNLEIPFGVSVTVRPGASLAIADGKTLVAKGKLVNNGAITGGSIAHSYITVVQDKTVRVPWPDGTDGLAGNGTGYPLVDGTSGKYLVTSLVNEDSLSGSGSYNGDKSQVFVTIDNQASGGKFASKVSATRPVAVLCTVAREKAANWIVGADSDNVYTKFDTALDACGYGAMKNTSGVTLSDQNIDEYRDTYPDTDKMIVMLQNESSAYSSFTSGSATVKGAVDCAGNSLKITPKQINGAGLVKFFNGNVTDDKKIMTSCLMFYNCSGSVGNICANTYVSAIRFYDSPGVTVGYNSDYGVKTESFKGTLEFYGSEDCKPYSFDLKSGTCEKFAYVYSGRFQKGSSTKADYDPSDNVYNSNKIEAVYDEDAKIWTIQKIGGESASQVEVNGVESSLKDAVANAVAGKTTVIVAKKDIELSEDVLVSAGQDIRLDISGWSVSGNFKIVNNGTLEILDQSGNSELGTVGMPIENNGRLYLGAATYDGAILLKGGFCYFLDGRFNGAISAAAEVSDVRMIAEVCGGTYASATYVHGSASPELKDLCRNEGYVIGNVGAYTIANVPLTYVVYEPQTMSFTLRAFNNADKALYAKCGKRADCAIEEWVDVCRIAASCAQFNSWKIDCVVTFDRKMPAGGFSITGFGGSDSDIDANVPYCALMQSLRKYGAAPYTYSSFLPGSVNESKFDMTLSCESAHRGTTCDLEMRLAQEVSWQSGPKDWSYKVSVGTGKRRFVFGAGTNVAMLQPAAGGATFYSTLALAVAADATTGKTIKLSNDCDEKVTVSKVCTIDTNGFGFTGEIKAGDCYAIEVTDLGDGRTQYDAKLSKVTVGIPAVANTTLAVTASEGEVTNLGNGQYQVAPGATVTATYTPNEGYFGEKIVKTIASAAEGAAVTVSAEEAASVKAIVAKIGEAPYASLGEAVAAAESGETIDVVEESKLTVVEGVELTVTSGKLVAAVSVNNVLELKDGTDVALTWPTNVEAAKGRIIVTGGRYSANPSAFLADGLEAKEKDGKYVVGVKIISGDTEAETFITTEKQESKVEKLEETEKAEVFKEVPEEKVAEVVGKIEQSTKVEGVKLTVVSETEQKPAGIVAVVEEATKQDEDFAAAVKSAAEVSVKVEVEVKPTEYVAPSEQAQSNTGKVAFKLTPKATVTVGEGDGKLEQVVPVTNDMIDRNQKIAVSIYTGFRPVVITHDDDNGARIETFEGDDQIVYNEQTGVATVQISHFSTLTSFGNANEVPAAYDPTKWSGAIYESFTDKPNTVEAANAFIANMPAIVKNYIAVDAANKSVTLSSADAFAFITYLPNYLAALCVLDCAEKGYGDPRLSAYWVGADPQPCWTVNVTTDIDLQNQAWAPAVMGYSYLVDFNNHTVSNLKATGLTTNGGLFGDLYYAQNVTIDGAEVVTTADNAGVLAGALNGFAKNVTVKNATLSGNKYTGAIGGYVYGDIEGCKVLGTESAPVVITSATKEVGAVAGLFTASSIKNCEVVWVRVTGEEEVGGIVGRVLNGDVKEHSIEECSVANVTLKATKNGDTVVEFGVVGGGAANYVGLISGRDYHETLTITSESKQIYPELSVAKIGETEYATLAEAVAAVKAGWTVTLIADCAEAVTGGTVPFVLEKGGKNFTGSITPAEGFKTVASPIAGDDSIRYMPADEEPLLAASMRKTASGFYQDGATYATAANYYITSREGLAFFADICNSDNGSSEASAIGIFTGDNRFSGKVVHLLCDVDLDKARWIPIGWNATNAEQTRTGKECFCGAFNGENHVVSNVAYEWNGTPPSSYLNGSKTKTNGAPSGFFGYFKGPAIANLTLDTVTISGAEYTAGIVAQVIQSDAIITNCHLTGKVEISGTGSFVGGIVGHGPCGLIDDCSVIAETGSYVRSTGIRDGGIIGYSTSSSAVISGCKVRGLEVSTTGKYIIGGIVGTMTKGATMSACAIENVSVGCASNPYFGLLVGRVIEGSGVTFVTNCTVVSSTAIGGGVQVFTQSGEAVDSDVNVVGRDVVLNADGKVTGGIFECIPNSQIAEGHEKVSLGTTNPETWTVQEAVLPPPELQGSGTAADPWQIWTLADLKTFRDNVNANGKYCNGFVSVFADIDLGGEEWTPIGTGSNGSGAFYGTFDGQEHVISNLKIDSTASNVGLFGYAGYSERGGTIKNLTIENAEVKGANNVAALAGYFHVMTLIENVHVVGTVKIEATGADVGGIVGKTSATPVIKNCSVVATPESGAYIKARTSGGSASAGGMIGFAGGEGGTSEIRNCLVANVDFTSYNRIGGIAGSLQRPSGYGSVDMYVTGCKVSNVTVTVTGPSNATLSNRHDAQAGLIVGCPAGSGSRNKHHYSDNTYSGECSVTAKSGATDIIPTQLYGLWALGYSRASDIGQTWGAPVTGDADVIPEITIGGADYRTFLKGYKVAGATGSSEDDPFVLHTDVGYTLLAQDRIYVRADGNVFYPRTDLGREIRSVDCGDGVTLYYVAPEGGVCKIGDRIYETLADALREAKSTDTVVLTAAATMPTDSGVSPVCKIDMKGFALSVPDDPAFDGKVVDSANAAQLLGYVVEDGVRAYSHEANEDFMYSGDEKGWDGSWGVYNIYLNGYAAVIEAQSPDVPAENIKITYQKDGVTHVALYNKVNYPARVFSGWKYPKANFGVDSSTKSLTVTVKSGKIEGIRASSKVTSKPTEATLDLALASSTVNVEGGEVGSIVSSWNFNQSIDLYNVNVSGGKVGAIYGNGQTDRQSAFNHLNVDKTIYVPVVKEANITITGGEVETVYGGGYGNMNPKPTDSQGPWTMETQVANITVKSGVVGAIYGGGQCGAYGAFDKVIVDQANITISGGCVGSVAKDSGVGSLAEVKAATATISGGIYATAPDAANVATGYEVVNNPDEETAATYPKKVQEKTVKTEDDKPIVVDISKASGEPSTEAVKVPVTVTEELAKEILKVESSGELPTLQQDDIDKIVTQLETKGEDGMTGWQKYAAGFSQTDKHPLAPKGKGGEDGKLVLVTSLVAPKQLSVDTGVKVKYILMQGSNVNQATGLPTAWTKVMELPTPEFPVDVTTLQPETYWKIDVEYTATRVVETEVEPAN